MLLIYLILGITYLLLSPVGSCQAPSLPEGSYYLTCGTLPGSVCQVSCRNGRTILEKRCLENGTWVGDVFRCPNSNDCQEPLRAPGNGSIVGTCSLQYGSVCNFKCNLGYDLVGSIQVYCFGNWSSSPPKCVQTSSVTNATTVKCPALSTPANGYVDGKCYKGAAVGSVCYFGCITNYILYGSSSAICLSNGQWSSAAPICIKLVTTRAPNITSTTTASSVTTTEQSSQTTSTTMTTSQCKSIQSVKNGKLRGNCQSATSGSTCSIVCSPGYYHSGGSTSITCQKNGQWSGKLASCARVTYLLVRTWYW